MTAPESPPPNERTRVEQLLIRLIQGHDEELKRLDRIRRGVEFAPVVMGMILVAIEFVPWFLRQIVR